MEKLRLSAAVYYLLQGLSVAAWWAVMSLWPSTRAHFELEQGSRISLDAFFLGDVLFIAPVSLAAAWMVYARIGYATAAMWLVTGGIGQATLYTLAFVYQTDRGWLGVSLMLLSLLWSGVFATALTVRSGMFREARQSSDNYIVFKTFAQIGIVWSVILVIFPFVITLLEDKLGIPRLEFAYQRPLAAVVSCWSVRSAFGRPS